MIALTLCCYLTNRQRKDTINFPGSERRRKQGNEIQRRLESSELELKGQKNAGSPPTLPEARALQANPPRSSRWRQALKGQLHYLISACLWALEFRVRGACLVCLILRMWALPHSFRTRGPTCPPKLPKRNGYRPGTVLCSGGCKDKLPLLRILTSQGKGTTVQWVPLPYIISFNLSKSEIDSGHLYFPEEKTEPQTAGTNLTLNFCYFQETELSLNNKSYNKVNNKKQERIISNPQGAEDSNPVVKTWLIVTRSGQLKITSF